MQYSKMTKTEHQVLSYTQSAIVLNLAAAVADYDDEIQKIIQGKSFTFQMNAIGGPKLHMVCRNGEVKTLMSRKFWPSLTLLFLSPKGMNRKLAYGKSALLLPIFGGFKAGIAFVAFQSLMDRVQYYLGGTDEVKKNHSEFLARLSLTATVFGASMVATYDPSVKMNTSKIKDGIIEIFVEGSEKLAAYVEKKGDVFIPHSGRAPKRGNAQLIFKSPQIALGVLAGGKNATVELAMGNVDLIGNKNMVNHLFPVLDRLKEYLKTDQ